MKAILPILLFLSLSITGCASSNKETGLISELYAHGCDLSSYETNERLGSLRVTCQDPAGSGSSGNRPLAAR